MSLQRRRQGQSDLFQKKRAPGESADAAAPLAERMRPNDFTDFFGQDDIIAPGRPFRHAIETDTLSSVIFWGPPGSGKTTLAYLIAHKTKAEFVAFSAVTSGVPELRQLVAEAEQRSAVSRQRTILFVDEIHRFNKAQQDAFLPHVERGTVILVGATTENPSFEVISPLLSRSLVVVLKPLPDEAMGAILDRAIADRERGLGQLNVTLSPEARRRPIGFGNGDARAALTALEFVVTQTPAGPDGHVTIDERAMDAALLKKAL
ncbi:MAG: AAA family ATPase, partial [Nitrospirota bacterium]